MSDPLETLSTLRADPRQRYGAMAVGAVVGLGLALVHWIGLVVGGALVGLAATDLKRALVAGLAFGALAWLAFAAWLAFEGVLGGALGTGQVVLVSAAIPLVCGLLGSLARGIV